jgi:hypothetical protein
MDEADNDGRDGSLDTGAPPGVHPNSDEPDPEVVKEAEEAAGPLSTEELHERYGAGAPPSGEDPAKQRPRPDAGTAD